jgi:dipeptidyl aminopeptidase/acylaminoacyl peptidase
MRTGFAMRRFSPWLAMCCTWFALTCSIEGQQQKLAPLPVRDALVEFALTPAPISLSPDNKWIAFTINDPNRTRFVSDKRHQWISPSGTPVQFVGCDIWLANIETGETLNLTRGRGNSWAPAWSPDGRYLAFYSDRGGIANLWIWAQSSRTFRKLSALTVYGYQGLSTARWTADSRKVLLSVLPEKTTIEEAAALTVGMPQRGTRDDQNAENGSGVKVFTSRAVSRDSASKVTEQLANAFDTYINGYVADMALIDVAGGDVRRLFRGEKPCGYWPSPDGSHIALTNLKSGERGRVYDLVTISLSDGGERILAKDLQQGFVGFAVSWSADSRTLSYTSYEVTSGAPGHRECYLVSVSGGEPRKVSNGPGSGFSQPFRAPLWDSDGQYFYLLASNSVWRISRVDGIARELARIPNRTISDIVTSTEPGRLWSPDAGRSLIVSTLDPESRRVGFSKVNSLTGEVTTLVEENKVYGGNNALLATAVAAPSSQTFIYVAEDAAHSPDFWTADAEFRNAHRLTHINPQFDKYLMGTGRLIEWQDGNGQRLSGALLLPAGYEAGKRYPLIVQQYPDAALSAQVNLFGFKSNSALDSVDNKQLLATRGYAVLMADSKTRVGSHMQDIAKSVLPGVDKVIEMGVADPERLGVIGFSHGGYSVLSLIVQTTRFKAAVDWAGPGNLITMYGQMDPDGRDHWHRWAEVYGAKIGGTPWEFRDRYVENSPIFHFDKVQTPLLIVWGTAENVTPSFLGDEIFVAFRRLGKEVEYARYEGEDHRFRNFQNKVDYCSRMLAWFDKWLTVSRSGNSIQERR